MTYIRYIHKSENTIRQNISFKTCFKIFVSLIAYSLTSNYFSYLAVVTITGDRAADLDQRFDV
jgi:hypothetical protein